MSARERLAAQDAQLERLGAGVDRIRNLGETMHDETRQQLGLLDQLEGDVDKTTSGIREETKHAEDASTWQTRVEQAHQRIKYPETAGMYGGIRSGIWYDDLCGFSFGPRPADTTEFLDEARYTEADNDKIALSRTITATRCTNCGYLYAMSVTGGKLRAMRHRMMDAVLHNPRCDDGQTNQGIREDGTLKKARRGPQEV